MIRLNDFERQWREIGADAHTAFERVGASGWYILGRELDLFEGALAGWWGLPFACGVASGLDAIEIALRATGLAPGGAVLTTPLSAFATSLAVVRAGGRPVFVDVDASGLLDLELCEAALRTRRDIRHLLPVHLYGHAMDLDGLDQLARRHGLTVVEDCAQAIGARWHERPVGSAGRAAATSFYPTKNLGALGDAGAVLTADPAVAETARVLRHYGQAATYEHRELGLNSRLDEMHAALLRSALLPRLAGWTARRRAIAERYRAGLAHPAIGVPPVPAGSRSVWHLFPVLLDAARRDDLRAHLRARGIDSGVHYPKLIPHQEAWRRAGAAPAVVGSLANAERFAAGEVSLPIHPYLADDEVDAVIAACNEWRPAP